MARQKQLRKRRRLRSRHQRSLVAESLESRLLLTTDLSGTIGSDQEYRDDIEITGNVAIDGDITIETTGVENHTFTLQAGATITGNGDDTRDNLTIKAQTVYIYGQIGGGGMQNITIEADEIYILDDAVLTTRLIDDESSLGNFGTADSTGNSGDLTLTSSSSQLFGDQLIQIQNDTGTTGPRLWTQATDGYQAGGISLDADDTAVFFQSVPWGGSNKDATISIQDAELLAGTISVTANAADNNILSDIEDAYSGGLFTELVDSVSQAVNYLFNALVVPVSVQWRSATADVTVEDSTMIASGDVTLSSTTTTDATVEAISVVTQTAGNLLKGFTSGGESLAGDSTTAKVIEKLSSSCGTDNIESVGLPNLSSGASCNFSNIQTFLSHFAAALSRGISDAQTQISGDAYIESTGGSVTVESNATNTGSATAQVFGNANSNAVPANKAQWDAAITATVTDTTALTSLSEDAEIVADGSASITATGTITSKASSKARVYIDGSAAIGLGVNVDNTTVNTQVDGAVTAGATFVENVINTGDITDDNEITLDDHGFFTGELVVYNTNGGDPIGGLTDGEVYRVRVTSDNTFQLTRGEPIDINNANVNSGVMQSLSPQGAYVIDSATQIDPDTDEFMVPDHGFLTGDQIVYNAGSTGVEYDGMTSGGDYYVIVTGADTFQLSSTLNRAADGIANIDLVSSDLDAGDEQIFSFVTLGQGETTFDAGSADVVDLGDSQFTIDDHGYYTAQFLNYSTGGGDPIGALDDRGFFAIVIDDDTFQLADTWDDAINGIAREFGDVEGVPDSTLVRDVSSNLVYQYIGPADFAYDLSSIDYAADAASDDPVWELTDIDGGAFTPDAAADMWDSDFTPTLGTGTQSLTYSTPTNQFDPSDDSIVSSEDNTIVIPNHGLENGDGIYYQTDPTYSEAGTVTGHNLFDPMNDVDLDRDRITFSPGPLLELGQEVAYWIEFDGETGTPVGGLTPVEDDADQRYYVIPVEAVDVIPNTTLVKDVFSDVVYEYVGSETVSLDLMLVDYANDSDWAERDDIDSDTFTQDPDANQYDSDYTITTIQLAASVDDAEAGTAIDLNSLGSGSLQTLMSLHKVTEHDTPIYGLSNRTYYNAVVIDENTIELADSYYDAVLAAPIVLDGSTATGDDQTFDTPDGSSGLTVSSTLTAKDTVKSSGKTGSNPKIRDFISTPIALLPVLTAIADPEKTKNLMAGKEKDDQGQIAQGFKAIEGQDLFATIGTGFAVNYFEHDVLTEVTSSAELATIGDLTISSSIDQTYQMPVESGTGKEKPVENADGSKGNLAVSAATSIGVYDNDSQALVYDGAELDAAGQLSVTSTVTYDSLNWFWEDDWSFGDGNITSNLWSLLQNVFLDGELGIDSLVNTWTQTKNKGKKEHGELPEGSIGVALVFAFQSFDNNSQANVGYREDDNDAVQGTKINQDPAYQNDEQAVLVNAETDFFQVSLAGIISTELSVDGAVKAYKKSDWSEVFNPYGNRAAVGVGVSGIMQILNNTTTAKIDEGVVLQTGVNGEAMLNDAAVMVNDRKKALAVIASEDVTSVELAEGGTEAEKFGLTGSATITFQTSDTIAQIAPDVTISGGGIGVQATNDETRVSIAGALEKTQAAGVGVGLAWNNVTRNTNAVIGEDEGVDASADGDVNIDVQGSVDLYGQNTGGMYVFGISGEFAGDAPKSPQQNQGGDNQGEAPAQAEGEEDNEPGADNEDNAAPSETDILFAGNVGIYQQNDTTTAIINAAGSITATNEIDLNAENDTGVVIAAGGFSMDRSSSQLEGKQTDFGFFGSIAWHEASLTTKAAISDVHLTSGFDVGAMATQDVSSLAITLTVAVEYTTAAKSTTQSLDIAGTASVIRLDSGTTEAYVRDATVDAGGDLELNATDTFSALGIAGSLDYDSARKAGDDALATARTDSASVGLSLAFNEITSVVGAYATNSIINVTGSITFMALASESSVDSDGSRQILSVAVAGGVSPNSSKGKSITAVLTGAGADNNVDSTVQSYADSGSIMAGGDATIAAVDGSNILSIAIGLGVDTSSLLQSQSSGSIAGTADAAASENTITATTVAYVDDVIVETDGSFSATATSQPDIQAYSFGISLAGARSTSGDGGGEGEENASSLVITGGGAGAGNTVNRVTVAYASVSSITTVDDVAWQAIDAATVEAVIVSLAGSFSGGRSSHGVAIGASAAVNHLGWESASADVAEYDYTSDDEPDQVETGDTVLIASGPLAGSIFEYVGDETLASPDLSIQNYNDSTVWEQSGANVPVGISAYISNSTVSAGGDLTVSVSSAPTYTADIGALTVATSGSIVFSYAKNNISDDIQAFISSDQHSPPSIQVNSLLVSADDNADADAVAVGASLAITVSTGQTLTLPVGVSVADNEIDNELAAFLYGVDIDTTGGDVTVTAGTGGNDPFNLDLASYGVTADQLDEASAWFAEDSDMTRSEAQATLQSVCDAINDALEAEGQDGVCGPDANDFVAPTYSTDEGVVAELDTGQTVIITDSSLGQVGTIYMYLGANAQDIDLQQQDYSDTDLWELQQGLYLTAVQEGESWQLVVSDGTTYTITLDSDSGTTTASKANINAVSIAASVAAVINSTASTQLSISGAGAVSLNSILSQTDAYIEDGAVDSAGAVSVAAENDAEISATVVAASLSIAATTSDHEQGQVGIGASLGVAIGRNYVGYNIHGDSPADATDESHVQAYLRDADVTAAGSLDVSASASQAVNSTAGSGSAAVVAGQGGGVALDGSGVGVQNKISMEVSAYAQNETGSPLNLNAGNVTIEARDQSAIDAYAATVTIAAAWGTASQGAGGGISVAATTAENEINNRVLAYVLGGANSDGSPDINAPFNITSTDGDIEITASESASIEATAWAASLGASLGTSAGSASGGGAVASNTIDTTTNAYASNVVLAAAGGVEVLANESPEVDAEVVTAAVSIAAGAGGTTIAPAIGVALATNNLGVEPDPQADYTVSSDSYPGDVAPGETVSVEDGILAGAVYEYIGTGTLSLASLDDLNLLDADQWAEIFAPATAGIVASLQDSSVTASGDLTIEATNNASISATVIGVGVGLAVSTTSSAAALAGVGASVSNTIKKTISAFVDNGQAPDAEITVDGAVSVNANDATDVTAKAEAVSVVVAGGAGSGISLAIDVGVALASSSIDNDVQATIQQVTVAADSVDVAADSTPIVALTSQAISVAGALNIGEGVLESIATSDSVSGGGGSTNNTLAGSATAQVENSFVTASGDVTVQANYSPQVSDQMLATDVDVDIIAAAAAGAVAELSADPTVEAKIFGGQTQADAVSIAAQDQRSFNVKAEGVTVSGGLALGVSKTAIVSNGSLIASLGDDAMVKASSLTIAASRNADSDQFETYANAIAGTGGILIGASGAVAQVDVGGTVTASTGTNVTLPDGDVTISATSNTAPSADATGDTGAALAVGVIESDSSTNVQTSAKLGDGASTSESRTGDLTVSASAFDQNLSNAVAGQGGIISGDGASAKTNNTSQVAAELSGAQVYADFVEVSAENASEYAPASNTISASGIGVSGAQSSNTNTTSATASLGDNVQVFSTGTVSITSDNDITQTDNPNAQDSQDGTSAYAGAGGVYSGSAAYNEADLAPTSTVAIGESVQITSGTDPVDSAGGIFITASGSLQVSDEVKLSTGGALAGGRAHSDLDVTTTNTVSIGSGNALTTWGDFDVGAYNFIDAQTNALANAGGVVGAANTEATTDVSSENTISVAGGGTTILAFGDVNLSAGGDPTGGNNDSLTASTTANSQSYGIAGIPTMNTETELDNTSTVTVAAGATVEGGGDVTLNAYGTPSGSFYQNGTWNDLDIIDANQGDATVNTTNEILVDGAVTAGVYHTLDVSIPNDQSASDGFSRTLTMTSSGPDELSLVNYILDQASFEDSFDARSFVDDNFGEESAAFLSGTLSDDPVGAFTLDNLYAGGGAVVVNWDDSEDDPNQGAGLSGAGTITANGGASITVTNDSPDYLVVGEMMIPDDAEAGEILINGESADGGDTYDAVVIDSVSADQTPAIVIEQAFDGFVGDVASGPALLLVDTISNAGGDVSITNDQGSVGQTSTIYAEQINISAPNSVVTISTPGDYYVGTDPYSTWEDFMIWPGGNPADATTLPAETAVTYLANAVYNSSGQYDDVLDFIRFLVGSWQDDSRSVDDNTQSTASQVFLSDVVAYDAPDSGGTDSLDNSLDISLDASADLLVKTSAYQISRRADDGEQRGWFPEIAIRDLSLTASDYHRANLPDSSEPNLQASAVSITADTIGLNGSIQTSEPNDWSLLLSSDLTDDLLAYQDQFDSGATSDPEYNFPLQTINDGDVQINAVYDARSGRIVVDDVSNTTPSGTVVLVGKIMSTNPNGKIDVGAPDGNVTIENETGIPLTTQKLETGGDADGSAKVSITDQNFDSSENQWLYVYAPGESVQVYRGAEGDAEGDLTLQTDADASSYQPLDSIRWQWSQQATLQRQSFGSGSSWHLGDWQWQEQDGVRWPYVDPTDGSMSADPVGEIVQQSTSNVFQQQISGSIDASHFVQAHYDKHQASNNSFNWWFEYITKGTLTMTMSVKADNPIAIDFSDSAEPVVQVTANASLLLTDDVSNPGGDVVFDVEHLSATRNASIETKDLTITASQGVGAFDEPVDVTFTGSELTANAGPEGIYLKVDSDVTIVSVSAGNETDGHGDVVIDATGDLSGVSIADGAAHISGKNITLRSRTASIGSAGRSLAIQPNSVKLINGAVRDGISDIDAQGNIYLAQVSGDMLVREIRSHSGGVFLDVPAGSVFDAELAVSAAPTRDEAEVVWAKLNSMDADYGAQGVATFEGFVEFTYEQYWTLLNNGEVQDGTFTLNDDGIDLYTAQAAAALDVSDPTSDDVQDYANDTYQSYVDFFNDNLPADWLSQADFLIENPDYQYGATDEQVDTLTRHTRWTEGDLTDLIQLDALDTPDATLDAATPNITGQTVTITAGGELGRFRTTLEIALEDIANETLTEEEQEMLALATAIGEAVLVGVDENGESVTYAGVAPPQGVTPTAVRLSIKRPALVSVTGSEPGAVSLTAPDRITFAYPAGDVSLGPINSDGVVEIEVVDTVTNSSSIRAASIVLTSSSGGIGTDSQPLLVELTGDAPGAFQADAQSGIYVSAVSGDLRVGSVSSALETVSLAAAENIVDAGQPVAPPDFIDVQGFGDDGDGWTVNSNNRITSTAITGDVLTLTDGGSDQARSVWFNASVPTDSFTASFTYAASGSRSADGVAFVFQNQGLHALGSNGGSLGYSGISGASAAYQINLWHDHQEGTNFNTNGVTGANGPNYLATGGVNLSSGNPIDVVLTYDQDTATLHESLTDAVTGATYTHSFSIDLGAILGSATMLIGFTGGTGGATSVQTISNFHWMQGEAPPQGPSESLVTAANINLSAGSGGIGSPDYPLWVTVGDGVLNATAQGDIYVNQQSGTLTVGEVVSDAGDIVLDPPEPGQSLVLTETSIVSALLGGVVLEARDDIELPAGSQIMAKTVSLRSALRDAAAGAGSRFILAGFISADSIDLLGSAGQDSIMIGSDGSNPGSLDNLRGLISVIGGGGADEMVLDDRGALGADGKPLRVGYAVTGNQIGNNPGADFGERLFAGLTYDASITQLRLRGSEGAGVFHVKPSDVTNFILDGDAADQAGGAGNRLILDPAGLAPGLDELGGSGEFSFGEGRPRINFSGMKQLEQIELGAVATGPTLFESSSDGAEFKITFQSFTALDLSNLLGKVDAILVTGPHGYSERAEFLNVVPSGDGTSQIATYRAPAPVVDAWQRSHNGEYLVEVAPNKITDSQGNPLPPREIGSFWVNVDAIWLTSILEDEGRYRLAIDNAVPGSVVGFAYSDEPGSHRLEDAGVTLDLADPVLLAPVMVPPGGSVVTLLHVPAEYTGSEILFQAFHQSPDPPMSPRGDAESSQVVSSTVMTPLVESIAPVGETVGGTGTIEFRVTFRQPVDGVTIDDFELAAGERVSGSEITEIRGGGSEFTLSVQTGTGDGTVTLRFVDEAAVAAAIGLAPQMTRNGGIEGEAFILHTTRQDVNLDAIVTPLDVLLLVNLLNRVTAGEVEGSHTLSWHDVNLDGEVTPIDALQVINYLIRQGVSGGEGEIAATVRLTGPPTETPPTAAWGASATRSTTRGRTGIIESELSAIGTADDLQAENVIEKARISSTIADDDEWENALTALADETLTGPLVVEHLLASLAADPGSQACCGSPRPVATRTARPTVG